MLNVSTYKYIIIMYTVSYYFCLHVDIIILYYISHKFFFRSIEGNYDHAHVYRNKCAKVYYYRYYYNIIFLALLYGTDVIFRRRRK